MLTETVPFWPGASSTLINNTSESVSRCCCVFSGFQHPNHGPIVGCMCVGGGGFALNSPGKNLKSSRLILSEAFRISTLYFISICEKRCHTAFASSYLLQLMFNSILYNFINPHGGNWFKGKKSASDNKIRDIKTESWWEREGGRGVASAFYKTNFVWRPGWSLHCVGSVFHDFKNLFGQLLQIVGFSEAAASVFVLHQEGEFSVFGKIAGNHMLLN